MGLRSTPAADAFVAKVAFWTLCVVGLLFLAFVVTVPLDVGQQLAFSAVVFLIAMVLRNRESRLNLEQRNHILAGGKRGPAVVANEPEKSLLYRLAARAAEHQDPDRVVGVDLLARAGQPLVHGPRQGVPRRRPVERERQHRPVPLDQDLVRLPRAPRRVAAGHRAVMPPSMTSSVPVTKRAWSEAR